MSFSAKSKFKFKNNNLFFPLLLLLSGNVSLNTARLVTLVVQTSRVASASSNRALHLIHLNINSLLPKID